MKCPCCGAAELIRDTREVSYTYRSSSTTFTAVTGDFCPACDELILDREQSDRYCRLMAQFRSETDEQHQKID
jgi:HTH-type transcriptional regulator/antitoxin MqsA